MNQKALVLGGTGFIGSHIANNLIANGYNVTVLRRHLDKSNFYNLDTSCRIIASSIQSEQELQKLSIQWDFNIVINSCGYGDHTLFSNTSYDVIGSHLLGTINIVKMLNRHSLKKYIHIGSSEEYGQLQNPSSELLREAPLTPYAFAKTASTHFLQMLFRSEEFPAIILRPFLVYGENQFPSKLVPYVVDSCLQDRDFELTFGDQYREFIHIDDLVEVVNIILKSDYKNNNGKIYDVCSGNVLTVSGLVHLVQDIVEKGNPKFGARKRLISDLSLLYSGSSNLFDDYSWRAKISIEEGIRRMIKSRS